eukprot:3833545-Ditylum_brightwellii.AAC.1
MQLEIKSDPEYESQSKKRNPVWLLKTIKKIKSGLHPSRNKMRIYFLKLRKIMNIKQEGGETLDSFRKSIRVAIDNLSLVGGDGVIQPNMTGTGL